MRQLPWERPDSLGVLQAYLGVLAQALRHRLGLIALPLTLEPHLVATNLQSEIILEKKGFMTAREEKQEKKSLPKQGKKIESGTKKGASALDLQMKSKD